MTKGDQGGWIRNQVLFVPSEFGLVLLYVELQLGVGGSFCRLLGCESCIVRTICLHNLAPVILTGMF